MPLGFIGRQFQVTDNYQLTSWLFLKLLALVYFAAFSSISVQITGLVGSNGILPFENLLDHIFQLHGKAAWLLLPNLFWINSSDFALRLVASLGCFFSLLLFFGVFKKWSLILLFVLYLSIFHAGQTFLTFQWDSLLLEAGFLAIFLVAGPTPFLIFLFHWLLFRLRFMSGISKLASGDPAWSGLTTLETYFETQPLPHVGAWYFHQLPDSLLKAGTVFVFFTELIVPLFIFLPRKFRITAALITILMQLLVIATSNHNWINLLTIVLCLFLLDDAFLRKWLPGRLLPGDASQQDGKHQYKKQNLLLAFAGILIVVTSVTSFMEMVSGKRLPPVIAKPMEIVQIWGIGHAFHVFPTMQTERHELQIQGSLDGKEWRNYEFRYKPNQPAQTPAFIVPHQPRLDWMIWFVPPQHWVMNRWFDQFLIRLKQASPEVLALLKTDPFPGQAPQFIRVQVYRYKFTDLEERALNGNWWKTEYLGLFPYVPPRRP